LINYKYSFIGDIVCNLDLMMFPIYIFFDGSTVIFGGIICMDILCYIKFTEILKKMYSGVWTQWFDRIEWNCELLVECDKVIYFCRNLPFDEIINVKTLTYFAFDFVICLGEASGGLVFLH
jgi:hypothetical protein